MHALLYLTGRSLKNRIRKALHKPVTYIYLVIILFYLLAVPFGVRAMFEDIKLDSPEGMTAVFTVFAFWVIPVNLVAYARRKGLIYRRSDAHFLFPSPIGPKTILLYAHSKTLLTGLFMNIVLVLGCIYVFQVEPWRMLLYFLFTVVVENTLEGGIMLLLYGSERLGERERKWIVAVSYGLIGLLVLLAFVTCLGKSGSIRFEDVLAYLHSDGVQMVPLIGWYVAVLHLLFLGPTAVNVICSLLYLGTVVLVVWAAIRMKCTGEYFEDAEKFADDYDTVLETRRQGRTDVQLGRKKKVGKASITYRGKGAKAIFYRQLLEYKKSRFFIFDINTLCALIAGCFVSFLCSGEEGFAAENSSLILAGAMAYVTLIFSAYQGKWGKELLTPYTFLIPDNPFRKLWYATLMQHVQALVNGCLYVLVPVIVLHIPLSTAALTVLCYVVFCACKLYILTVAEVAVGNVLGNVGKQFFQLFLLGIVILLGVLGAALGMALGGINLAYVVMLVLLSLVLVILLTISTLCFYRMETLKS